MKDFNGRLAVITGAGSGMGRELALQLAAAGCNLGLCDIGMAPLEETRALCRTAGPAGLKISIHRCDVADENQVLAFRDGVVADRRRPRQQAPPPESRPVRSIPCAAGDSWLRRPSG